MSISAWRLTIKKTRCRFGSWVPGFFTGEGHATIYDVNLNPKPAYTELQQDLRLASGAPHRVPSGAGL